MLFGLMPHNSFAQNDLVGTAAFSCSSLSMCTRSGNFVDQTINVKD